MSTFKTHRTIRTVMFLDLPHIFGREHVYFQCKNEFTMKFLIVIVKMKINLTFNHNISLHLSFMLHFCPFYFTLFPLPFILCLSITLFPTNDCQAPASGWQRSVSTCLSHLMFLLRSGSTTWKTAVDSQWPVINWRSLSPWEPQLISE